MQGEDKGRISYGELYQRSNDLVSEMLRKGFPLGSRVAVFQSPSVVDWAASVLAIFSIGAVYVPLDVATPDPRLSSIVRDCRPVAILAHGPTLDTAKRLGLDPKITVIDVSKVSATSQQPPTILAQPDAPAIILYTSGSTGTPKGVILQHASLKHEFDHCAATYRLNEHDVVLQQSAWSFDVSVTQFFLALCVGARLQMVSHRTRTDPRALAELIANQGVTATYATPTEYKSWLRRENQSVLRATPWRLALVAGEAVTEPLLQAFREIDLPRLRLFNVYGPTETTCGSTKMELTYKKSNFYSGRVPVGRASANESFYILDQKQSLQPAGQSGEIVIGGVGVSMGYLNDDERTRASFLHDPFASAEYAKNGWTTMYCTGDVGYLEDDGTLVLTGRTHNDTQVKVNGVRIDLEDIEHTVLQTAGGTLADAVASFRSTSDETVSFVVVHVDFSEKGSEVDKSVFIEKLLAELPLPRTLKPAAIVSVDAMPRTLTGKADRQAIRALPLPQRLGQSTVGDQVLSQAEIKLRDLWKMVIPQELTSLHEIDGASDFFRTGGSSLLLIDLQHKIKAELGISVPLLKLFQSSELNSMAQCLDMEDTAGGDKKIDWNLETTLVPSGVAVYPVAEEPTSDPPRVIVLTGATGFLGQHLLDALVIEQHVEKVICISIRDLEYRLRESLVQKSPKVEWYAGDLRFPRLGLSEEEASRIFRSADAVIHNGADVSHLKTYASLRPANLASTQELARLCTPRKIPLHYVSTTGVTMYTTSDTYAEVSVRDAKPPTDGLSGYVASKWASEVYLENANAQHGLSVCIHRPSSVIRPESDVGGDSPVADVLQNMLDYSRRLGAVPETPGLRGFIDLVHPHTVVSKAISVVMGGAREKDATSVVYVHESGDLELNIAEIRDHLALEAGEHVRELPLEEWIRCAREIGLSSAMATVFSGTLGNAEQMNLPRLLRG